MGAYRSLMSASRFMNPVGRGAIRSASIAARKMAKANQLRLGLELRIESEAREKAREKKRKMTERLKEFRRTWDAGQGTRKKRTA
jgi:allophanate hydrolase subunit 2